MPGGQERAPLGFRRPITGSRRASVGRNASTPRASRITAAPARSGRRLADDEASGRGGIGPGSRGGWRRGRALWAGRGLEAGRGAAAGEGRLAGEGEIVSAEPSYRKPPATVRGVECATGACGFFFTRAWRGSGRRAFRSTKLAAARDDGRNRRACVDALCRERRSGRVSVRCGRTRRASGLIHDRVRRLLRLGRLLLCGAERGGDDPVDLRRGGRSVRDARRPRGADVQVSADENGHDEHEDPSANTLQPG